MEIEKLINIFMIAIVSVLGFFLKGVMDDIKEAKNKNTQLENRLDVLTNDHTNKYKALSDKLDDLKGIMVTLTYEIKELNKKI
jgi:uncharacterized membrane protein